MSSNSRPGRREAWTLAALATAGMILAGCASGHTPDKPATIAATPVDQFPLQAVSHDDEIRLAPHVTGLSRDQIAAVEALAGRWQDDGGGVVTIQSPLQTSDPRAAAATAAEVRRLLLRSGAPAERVRDVSYEPAAGAPVAVVVGFSAHEAVVAPCGRAWENLAETSKNKPMSNFGCAMASNMAAQIANPGDIAGARASDPADAGRRTFVIDKYRRSELTAGAKDAQSSGAVSSTGGSSGGGSGG